MQLCAEIDPGVTLARTRLDFEIYGTGLFPTSSDIPLSFPWVNTSTQLYMCVVLADSDPGSIYLPVTGGVTTDPVIYESLHWETDSIITADPDNNQWNIVAKSGVDGWNSQAMRAVPAGTSGWLYFAFECWHAGGWADSLMANFQFYYNINVTGWNLLPAS